MLQRFGRLCHDPKLFALGCRATLPLAHACQRHRVRKWQQTIHGIAEPDTRHSSRCSSTREAVSTASAAPSTMETEWSGLAAWRSGGVDRRRRWSKTSCEQGGAAKADEAESVQLPESLAECACLVLNTADPLMKAALSHRIWEQQCSSHLPLGSAVPPVSPTRPERPQLVPPRQIPTSKDSDLPLNAYMLLTLAHVELNAIDLAWDTVARFAHLQLPQAFYRDFAHVADDESRHFGWCSQRLAELGFAYGDMPAHNLLWEGSQASAGDITARLAVVPMGAEARGLDAAPRLVQRLMSANDHVSASIVALIGQQEKAHVGVGVSWFLRMSAALGRDPGASYRSWLSSLCPDLGQGRMNHEARTEVGLQRSWYDAQLWNESSRPQELDPLSATEIDAVRLRLATLLTDCDTVAAR